jgi:hypothetical protein
MNLRDARKKKKLDQFMREREELPTGDDERWLRNFEQGGPTRLYDHSSGYCCWPASGRVRSFAVLKPRVGRLAPHVGSWHIANMRSSLTPGRRFT